MAKDTGIPDIKWHRTKLSAETLKELNTRSDTKACIQAGGFVAILITTGIVSFYFWRVESWGWLIAALILHGTVSAFAINGVHELVHGTVFKTSWLNTFFCHLLGFYGWINNRFFWFSHTEHHKFTLHPPADLEVVVPIYHDVKSWFKAGFINIYGYIPFRDSFRLAAGKFKEPWETQVCDTPKRKKSVSNWSRTIIAGHLFIAFVCMANGLWIIPVLTSLTPFYGLWLFLLCNNTQHVGLVENVNDFRLNCRTFILNPVVRFLYWQMNFHIEHHMYAAVPCYNLARLHKAIEHELPRCPRGLIQTWVEIGYIMYRQKEDSEYRFIAELPDGNRNLSDKSRLQQIREQADQRSAGATVKMGDGPGRRWECRICGFIYEENRGLPEEGIAPGTAWEDIPEDWCCPDCGVSKAEFDMMEITDRESASSTHEDPIAETSDIRPVVVVGSGLAGYGLAREMQKITPGRKVVIVTRDGGDAYSKPSLSNALAQGKTPSQLPSASAEEISVQLNLEVRTRTTVHFIDRSANVIHTDKGDISYSKLVLAVGADPVRPPLKGNAAGEVLSVNDLDDYARFREKLPDKGDVAILGAGLIGCEFANDLFIRNHNVSVIDPADRPLGRLFPKSFGEALRDEFTEQGGVDWHLGDSVSSVDKKDGGRTVLTLEKSGETVEVDIVLAAIGLRPRLDLAKTGALATGRGIQVNKLLQTSDPDIYAIGDCAEVDGSLLPFIMPIMSQVRALAKTLGGKPIEVNYPIMPVVVKTPDCPLVIALPPEPTDGKWEISGEAPALEAAYRDEKGRLIGFALSGAMAQYRQDWVKKIEAS